MLSPNFILIPYGKVCTLIFFFNLSSLHLVNIHCNCTLQILLWKMRSRNQCYCHLSPECSFYPLLLIPNGSVKQRPGVRQTWVGISPLRVRAQQSPEPHSVLSKLHDLISKTEIHSRQEIKCDHIYFLFLFFPHYPQGLLLRFLQLCVQKLHWTWSHLKKCCHTADQWTAQEKSPGNFLFCFLLFTLLIPTSTQSNNQNRSAAQVSVVFQSSSWLWNHPGC